MATAVEKLTTELGAAPPDGFSGLADSDLEFLADTLKAAREGQAAGLDRAAEESLKMVPAIARGPVRRILFR
ncbi:hypothetical protein [Yinghuangia seranimata]|uniref:hypothetical protein n=1 Tax=Yinghuangia seranimata TaxID=408067 RepID=UPI00248B7EB7|nr:hypothetical protein [Yinghuangia seranimata]MDI2130026.1 hypothetical protein [Yinghuangia seranimata]